MQTRTNMRNQADAWRAEELNIRRETNVFRISFTIPSHPTASLLHDEYLSQANRFARTSARTSARSCGCVWVRVSLLDCAWLRVYVWAFLSARVRVIACVCLCKDVSQCDRRCPIEKIPHRFFHSEAGKSLRHVYHVLSVVSIFPKWYRLLLSPWWTHQIWCLQLLRVHLHILRKNSWHY